LNCEISFCSSECRFFDKEISKRIEEYFIMKAFRSFPRKGDFYDQPFDWCEQMLAIETLIKEKEYKELKKQEREIRSLKSKVR